MYWRVYGGDHFCRYLRKQHSTGLKRKLTIKTGIYCHQLPHDEVQESLPAHHTLLGSSGQTHIRFWSHQTSSRHSHISPNNVRHSRACVRQSGFSWRNVLSKVFSPVHLVRLTLSASSDTKPICCESVVEPITNRQKLLEVNKQGLC